MSRVLRWTLLALACVGQLNAYYYYQSEYLDSHCDGSIKLTAGSDRAGKILFWQYPRDDCTVNVTVNADGVRADETFAVYFNIKTLNLHPDDRITITEVHNEEETIVKELSGGYPYTHYSPTSVAQLLSKSSNRPLLSIAFKKGSPGTTGYGSLIIDYTVVHGQSDWRDEYCLALNGYILEDLKCESGDRVNCPRSYYDTVTILNPVIDTDQYCYKGATSTYDPDYSSYDYGPSGTPAIVGIVVGCLTAILILSAILFFACRQRTRMRMTQGIVNPHLVSTPFVVSGYQGHANPNFSPYGQVNVIGAPPTYSPVDPAQYAYPAGAEIMSGAQRTQALPSQQS